MEKGITFRIDDDGYIRVTRAYDPLKDRAIVVWNGIQPGDIYALKKAIEKTETVAKD